MTPKFSARHEWPTAAGQRVEHVQSGWIGTVKAVLRASKRANRAPQVSVTWDKTGATGGHIATQLRRIDA
jgi:hypothetical protein